MAKKKRKPRKNAGKVISLAAFRKKKAETEESEPDLRPTPMPAHMVGRGDVAKTLLMADEPDESPEEPERRGRGVHAMHARAAWVGKRVTSIEEAEERAAAMKDAMMVNGRLSRLLKITQGIYSPSTVQRNLLIVADYDDATLRRFAFKSTEKQWMEKPSFFRAVIREAADRWGMMAPPKDNPKESKMAKKNPNTTEHRGEANRLIAQAEKAYKSANTAEERGRPWQEAFDSYLTALVWAMMAYQEAEHGTPKKSRKRGARRMAYSVRSTEQYAITIAQGSLVALRGMVTAAKKKGRGKAALAAVGNPANIPGGNMTECIAIMEARGDVESPGALCNWLSRKAGERRGGRAGSRPKGTAKARGTLQRAMRGT